MANFVQIIYASQPFGYDAAILSGILLDARRSNTRDGITGALVCRQDIYLQLIEGPVAPVQAAFERISRDDRHLGIEKLLTRHVSDRMFGDWAMFHDPERSWIWTEAEIADGKLDHATPEEVVNMFELLSGQVKPEV